MSRTALLDAIRMLDLPATRQLLSARPSLLSTTDRAGRNLLHLACSASTVERRGSGRAQVRLVAFLLDQGFEIDLPVGEDSCTPLFFAAARARNPALVKFLLERGARVENAPGGGLFAAGWWDDVASLKLLVEAGAAIDVVVGVTPFYASWCWGRFRAAKFLVVAGADVNYQDQKGRTALHQALERRYSPALIRWLVAHGALPDVTDRAGVSARLKASRMRDRRYAPVFGVVHPGGRQPAGGR